MNILKSMYFLIRAKNNIAFSGYDILMDTEPFNHNQKRR